MSDCTVLAHHDVGMPRQPWMVHPVPETVGKQIVANQHFGFGRLAVYGCHTTAALFLCHLVHYMNFIYNEATGL